MTVVSSFQKINPKNQSRINVEIGTWLEIKKQVLDMDRQRVNNTSQRRVREE